MAQHDMNIANQGFPATRADLNNALQALASNNSGTSSPSTTFANQWWYDTNNNKLYIRNEANSAWIEVAVLDQTNAEWQIITGTIKAKDGDGIVFQTDDGTERIKLADNGDVTINETSADADFRVESNADTHALFVDSTNEGVGVFAGTGDTSKHRVAVGLTGAAVAGDTDGATIGQAAIFKLGDVANWGTTDSTVFLMGGGNGGVTGQISSAIGFARESSSNWGTQLKFYTHPTATSDLDDLDERARIDSGGNFMLGTTTARSGTSSMTFEASNSFIQMRASGTSGLSQVSFVRNTASSPAQVGDISTTGSATTYATSSDHRLKENVADISDGITRVKQLSPKRFNFIIDPDTTVDGFLAHEAQGIVPEAVTGTKDETEAIGNITDADGNTVKTGVVEPETLDEGHTWTATGTQPVMQGIDQAKLVPLLTAALQEAISKIETLETKVAALEG
jgi:hypothetical protein